MEDNSVFGVDDCAFGVDVSWAAVQQTTNNKDRAIALCDPDGDDNGVWTYNLHTSYTRFKRAD